MGVGHLFKLYKYKNTPGDGQIYTKRMRIYLIIVVLKLINVQLKRYNTWEKHKRITIIINLF